MNAKLKCKYNYSFNHRDNSHSMDCGWEFTIDELLNATLNTAYKFLSIGATDVSSMTHDELTLYIKLMR